MFVLIVLPKTKKKVVGSAPSVNSISGDSYSGDFDDDYEQLVILFPQLQPAKIEAMLKLLKSKDKALDKVNWSRQPILHTHDIDV